VDDGLGARPERLERAKDAVEARPASLRLVLGPMPEERDPWAFRRGNRPIPSLRARRQKRIFGALRARVNARSSAGSARTRRGFGSRSAPPARSEGAFAIPGDLPDW
jgi:hypothetical protein